MFSSIHSVSITVTDQDAAIDFYTGPNSVFWSGWIRRSEMGCAG